MSLHEELERMCRKLRRYRLCQRDFDRGTVRITKPGHYILSEDIVFNPNLENDGLPYAADTQYSGRPFVLGFFAAITVECPDVCIDLNGHELRQGLAHSLLQSFYSHIELCNTPFIPKQGPADFSKFLRSAYRVVVKNGCLGLSSHHGIHGNGARKVLIENLRIRDFSVSPIALNGGGKVEIMGIDAGPNNQHIPVLGTYSAAVFAVRAAESFIDEYRDNLTSSELMSLIKTNAELRENVKDVYREIMETGSTTDLLYRNKDGLLDGNAYGILIHPLGQAVGEFVSDVKNTVNGLYIKDVKIHDIKNKVDEIIALTGGKDVQRDATGAVFQFDVMSTGTGPHNRYYKGSTLSQVQLAMAAPIARMGIKYRTLSIDSATIEWALQGKSSGSYNMSWKCNGDAMFHENKGVVGLRLDGVHDGYVHNVLISDIENLGHLGNTEYCGAYRYSHDAQKVPGYNGADAIGINVSDSSALMLKDIDIRNITSLNGRARGLRIMFDSCDIICCRISIKCIYSGYRYKHGKWYGIDYYGNLVEYSNDWPNRLPASYGVEFYKTGSVALKEVKISNLQGPVTNKIYDDLE